MNWYLCAGREGKDETWPIAGPFATREEADALVPLADRTLCEEGVTEAFFGGLVYSSVLVKDHDKPGRFNEAFGVRL